MKAVIFGAGNIGRGFIAPLFSLDGWDVTFIDVQAPVIERINNEGKYPLSIVSNDNAKTVTIDKVRAVDGNDRDAACRAVAEADVCATCVGAKAIKYILPNFSAGVKIRAAKGKFTNLLLCENLMDADEYVRGLLADMLTADELETVGLIETSVGRMVPAPKAKGEGDDPLAIAVEEYGVLPIDRAAIKGDWKEVKNIVPFTPFHFYVDRKLFIHNMGHAVTAYLGDIYGDEYIWQSVSRPGVRLTAEDAMIESAMALSKKYGVEFESLMKHVWDLLRRFGNRALGDTCARVGADIPRKLSPSDRLVGAAKCAESCGIAPVNICVGIGAALFEYTKQNEADDAEEALTSLTSLADGFIKETSLSFYKMMKDGDDIEKLRDAADRIKRAASGMIV